MSGLNNLSFTGRLGADAEVKFTQGGTPIWTARVAVDYGWGDKKGTSWINAKAIGKQAEAYGKLELPKGSLIGGSGELQVREYERNGGGTGTAGEVLLHNLALIGPKPEGTQSRQTSKPAERAPAAAMGGDFNDDIPF